MLFTELKSKLLSGNVPRLIILCGPEMGFVDMYIDRVSKELDKNYTSFSSVKKLLEFNKNALFDDSISDFYVVRRDEEVLTNAACWEKLENYNNNLILVFDSIDKRSLFYKKFEQNIVIFEKQSNEILYAYFNKRLSLSNNVLRDLLEGFDNDLLLSMNELSKLEIFEPERQESLAAEFVTNGVFNFVPQYKAFDLVDQLLVRNKEAYNTYEKMRANESNIGLLALIYSSIKNLAVVKMSNLKDNNAIANSTGLTPQQVYVNKIKKTVFRPMELVEMMEFISNLDLSIKNGDIPESICIDYLLSRYL